MRIPALLAWTASACATVTPTPTQAPAPPPDATDLVSAVSAAGLDRAQGLDWPAEVAAKPAADVFKNARVLDTVPASRFMLAMQSMQGNLGVDCGHCHDGHDFKSDAKQPKQTARAMMKMAHDVDTRFFGGRTYVTCYTCHRGESQPEEFKPTRAPIEWPLPALAEADAKKPAGELYRNLKVLGAMPAGRVGDVMVAFSSALGTGCVHCHEPGKWAADDKPAKQRAREMLAMVRHIGETTFAGAKNPVRCGTCHRGQVRPARTPGPLLAVTATLPGGATAPNAILVLGPAGFAPKTHGELHDAVAKDEEAKILHVRAYQTTDAEIGHVAPGTYALCTMSAPADLNPAHDPRGNDRPVSCAPVTVAAEPDVQRVTRELPPL